jgi:hypothetical protein
MNIELTPEEARFLRTLLAMHGGDNRDCSLLWDKLAFWKQPQPAPPLEHVCTVPDAWTWRCTIGTGSYFPYTCTCGKQYEVRFSASTGHWWHYAG